jgi:hypothetical protein
MRRTRTYLGFGMVLALLILSACAAGPNELVDTGPDPAGFGWASGRDLSARSRL